MMLKQMPVLACGGAQAIGEAVIRTARAGATNVRGGVIESSNARRLRGGDRFILSIYDRKG